MLVLAMVLTLPFVVSEPASEVPLPKPLPGNQACAFPSAAQKKFVAGVVRYMAQVTPTGDVASVDIRAVPLPDLGFEEAVRGCISQWRFEPAAAGETALRPYEGQVRFRVSPDDELAVRELLERLAAAWNAGDESAIEDLEARHGELPALPPQGERFLRKQIQADQRDDKWRIELMAEVSHVRFVVRDLVEVGQPYRRVAKGAAAATEEQPELAALDLTVAKGPRGWRFVRITEADRTWLGAARVGGGIREPRKLKHVNPDYPDLAKQARVQGIVILECLISPEGKVTKVKVLRSLPMLDEAAMEAVRRWEYTPTLLDGRPVPVIMTVTVNFRLS